MRIAVYVSAHGFGHAVRAAAVLGALQRLVPLQLTVLAACDRRIWPESLAACTSEWIPESCDVGVEQSDDVTVDLAGTGRRLKGWLKDLESIREREISRLAAGFDLVLGDVPSPVFDAAHCAGIPSVAVANFSWDWIYSELGFRSAAEAAAEAYAKTSLLIEAAPFGPMPSFPRRESVGLVARTPSDRRVQTRERLEVHGDQSLVVMAFQPASAPSLVLPPRRPGRVYAAPTGFPGLGERPDFRELPSSVTFLDALAAADVVLGKPGYGLIGDVDTSGVRFLYVPRPGFPENAVLENHLEKRPGTRSLTTADLALGRWEDLLVALEESEKPAKADADGAARAARAIAALLAVDLGPVAD